MTSHLNIMTSHIQKNYRRSKSRIVFCEPYKQKRSPQAAIFISTKKTALLGVKLLTAIFPLALQHPTRILARQRADRVKLAQLIFTQANSGGGNVILQLLGPFGANNNAGDRRLMQ